MNLTGKNKAYRKNTQPLIIINNKINKQVSTTHKNIKTRFRNYDTYHEPLSKEWIVVHDREIKKSFCLHHSPFSSKAT